MAIGDRNRAYLLRHLTQNWATQYTATLITTILATPPYLSSDNTQRERFIRAFARDWDFSKLSEFFMYLQSRAKIDYKLKCIMLQEAAQRDREALSAKLHSRMKRAELKSRQEASPSMARTSNSIVTSNATFTQHSNSSTPMDLDPHQLPSPTTSDCHHVEPMVTEHDRSEPMIDLVDRMSPLLPTTADSMASHTGESVSDGTAPESTTTRGLASPPASSSASEWRHHRRTSSNDATDMNKRFRLSRTAIEAEESENIASSSSADTSCLSETTNIPLAPMRQPSPNTTTTSITDAYIDSSTTTTTISTASMGTTGNVTMIRRASPPDHSYFHHHIICSSSSSAAAPTQSAIAPSAASSRNIDPGSNASGSNSDILTSATATPEHCHHHHCHHHRHLQAGDTGGIGSDLSHLHLGFAGGGGPSSGATSTASSSPPNNFTSSRHTACYPTPPPSSSAPSSHLQVHRTFRLRRRSSSSSSTASTGSVGTSHPIGGSGNPDPTSMDHLEDDSGVKKRAASSVSNQEAATSPPVY
ncbi:hypothetical protein BX666DRAFT_2070697 [Dichotomocladium elegans]|nr:hypothetical protein BX666DRAFT_2070697 [Dichotomocladium elegans]